jgi:hypothetical protein
MVVRRRRREPATPRAQHQGERHRAHAARLAGIDDAWTCTA